MRWYEICGPRYTISESNSIGNLYYGSSDEVPLKNAMLNLYHGSSRLIDDGESPPGRMTYLTSDKEDAQFYGRYVYKCEARLGKIADLLWTMDSPAYQAIVAKFSTEHPGIAKFIDSGKMWEINKPLEVAVRNYLMIDLGYDSINFRDDSPVDGAEVGSYVTWSKNVRIIQRL